MKATGVDDGLRDVWGLRPDDDLLRSLDLIDGGVWFENLAVFAHRCYDATTRQWSSPDPLPGMPGMPGAGTGYTFNWLDPVNFVDPSGLRPLLDVEWEENYNKDPIDRFVDAVPWDVVAGVGVVALCCRSAGRRKPGATDPR